MSSQPFGAPSHDTARGESDQPFEVATVNAVERAASVLCKRWKPALLYLLSSGHHRYNALARRLPSTTPKMLTQQLRDLERDGLLVRFTRSGGPRHVEYRLTPMGEAIRPAVESLAAWGRQYGDAPPAPVNHGDREVSRTTAGVVAERAVSAPHAADVTRARRAGGREAS